MAPLSSRRLRGTTATSLPSAVTRGVPAAAFAVGVAILGAVLLFGALHDTPAGVTAAGAPSEALVVHDTLSANTDASGADAATGGPSRETPVGEGGTEGGEPAPEFEPTFEWQEVMPGQGIPAVSTSRAGLGVAYCCSRESMVVATRCPS